MSAKFKTKYTDIRVDVDDAKAEESYFGYIAIDFEVIKDPHGFFMEAYDLTMLDMVKVFFQSKPNFNVEKDIYLDDLSIMINLPSVRSKVYAADLVRIVKECEQKFDAKVMDEQ